MRNGGAVPLSFDEGHWEEGTTSTIFGTSTQSETAFDPTLALGDFKPYTDLDVAALQDIGWDIVPEPSQGILLLWAAALGLCGRRRPNPNR